MRPWLKRLLVCGGAALALVVALIAALVINVLYFKPFSIKVFYETAFLEYILDDPEMLSSMRLLEQFGLEFHNDDLTDVSPARTEKLNEMTREGLAMLRRYDRSRLEGQVALSYDVLEYYLQTGVDGIPYTWHGYPVNQMFGVQSSMPDFMANIHHVGSVRGARDYVTRLSKFDDKFDGLIEDLRLRESKGIVPPRFVVEKVLAQIREFRGTPPKENILFTVFEEKLRALEGLDAATRGELLADAEREIERAVYDAYDALIAYFEHLGTKATENHGVWALPDGDAYYDYRLRASTTTDLGADEIHALGLAEVERILGEMDTILRAEGHADGSVAERMTTLNDDPRFLYPNDDEGRARILADFQSIVDEVSARAGEWFGTLPRSRCEVRRVPEFREATTAGAYYQGPSMDGTRPGVFYANLRDLKEHPKYGMRTLAYHEAVPGHHFQTALQVELTGVPQFRKILGFTAFAEGWALYAERLAWEAGLQDDPYDNLGRLQAELFRAVRLVVDTGIHRQRWTRERAIEYMASTTGIAEHDVVAEIERYFVFPGQATAYKIGMIRILELRERAKTALGDAFDLREFHDAVLLNGDIPLPILEKQIEAYIERALPGTPRP